MPVRDFRHAHCGSPIEFERGWSVHTLLCVVLVSLIGPPAGALDFSSEQLVYREDYEAEVAYPTTPEIDLVSVGGGLGGAIPNNGETPELIDGVARVSVAESGGALASIEAVVYDPGVLDVGDFGLRGVYSNFAFTGDGRAFAGVIANVVSADLLVTSRVQILRDAGVESAGFTLLEFDTIAISELAVSNIFLSGAQLAALLAGAEFTIDLFVDRVTQTAFGSITIDGFSATTTSIALTALGNSPLSTIDHAAGNDPANEPATADVDMEEFEMYSRSASSYNLDVGVILGLPSVTYGAAGSVGTWNQIELGTTADLVNISGSATSVSVTLVTETDKTSFPGGTPDDEALLGDQGVECSGNPDTWSLTFAGLPNGLYRVFVYSASNPLAATGDMDVGGSSVPNLPGDTGSVLIEGVSWAQVEIAASGTLVISGSEGTSLCAAIAGVQLTAIPPPAVPSLPAVALGILASLIAGVGVSSRRYAGRCG